MEGVAQPHTLLPGGASPHSYNMRPSDARALNQADLIFWGSEALETFLARSLRTLPNSKRQVELSLTPGLDLGLERQTGLTASTIHDAERHGPINMHFWLSTTNAQILVDEIASALVTTDPDHKSLYQTNAVKMKHRLSNLKNELDTQLQGVRNRPYMVYHDAYWFFEDEFELKSKGAIVINPDVPLGAASVAKLRGDLNRLAIVCIFSEPQFKPQLIKTLTEGTSIRTESLDPLGAGINPGPDGYFILMRRLGSALHRCLSD